MNFSIQGYLKKFEQFLPFETQVKNVVISAVQEEVGITLQRPQIAVSRGVVFIHASSVIKSEIMLKKVKILDYIKRSHPDLSLEIK
jgi:hypothetical protein